jgi:undecaprenyl diphosphate synthase
MDLLKMTDYPNHVAIIMDGNGRWASIKGFARTYGHNQGANILRDIIQNFLFYKVKFLTLYAFSTENWSRPQKETHFLMNLLIRSIDHELAVLHKKNIRIIHLGKKQGLPNKVVNAIDKCIDLTKNNDGMILSIALNYGGRDEILNAIKSIINDNVKSDELSKIKIEEYLYTAELPDPDLIIRTGGEIRISNFLLWQSAYSEYYFTDTLWPDFNKTNIKDAMESYLSRKRRYGKTV